MIYYFDAAAQTITAHTAVPAACTRPLHKTATGALEVTVNADTDAEAFATNCAYSATVHAFWAFGLTAKQHRALIGKVEAAKLGETIRLPSGRWTPGQFTLGQRQCR